MFPTTTYQHRRQALRQSLGSGIVLLFGNQEMPKNYTDNVYHFRQDSHFLYFVGIDQPALAAVLDLDAGDDLLFGDEMTLDHIIWMGEQPSLAQLAAQSGMSRVLPYTQLAATLRQAQAQGRTVHFLPPYRHDNQLRLFDWLGIHPAAQAGQASVALIKAIVAQRSHKTDEEVAQMEAALDTTAQMHLAVMQAAREGVKEAELAGIAHAKAIAGGGDLAYGIILTVNGQILHNHAYHNTLQRGQLVLGDFGAETAMHYAGDITRTFPVGSPFNQQQRAIYDLVLAAETKAIAALRPQTPYRDIHLLAAHTIASGLTALGLMKGDPAEAVAQGAHALFFPHGLGHLIGLDVHDMEDVGEDYVGYNDAVQRSTQFGLRSLRLGRALEPGFVLTVEPGIYFIPQLIDQWQAAKKFTDFINYEAVNAYRNLGGIRIEDNCLITESGYRVLGTPIPKTPEAIMNIIGRY